MVRRARAELGVTVIWVEHVMKAVMSLAERILVLNFGQLIADGRPDEVMRQPDVVTAYLGERGGSVSHDVSAIRSCASTGSRPGTPVNTSCTTSASRSPRARRSR